MAYHVIIFLIFLLFIPACFFLYAISFVRREMEITSYYVDIHE